MIFRYQLWAISSLFFVTISAGAQVTDDFSDDDLTSSPAWVGELDNFSFDASAALLRSQGPSSTTSYYLSTSTAMLDRVSWEFVVRMNVNPSDGNNVRIFLASDQPDLLGDLNGYFLRLGENLANDGIDLYRKEGSVETKLADGPDGQVATTPHVRIRVIRDAGGTWEVAADLTGGTDFAPVLSHMDNTITATSYFGIVVNQTTTNRNNFYFGDLSITQLQALSVQPESNREIVVEFDQNLPKGEVESVGNYSLSDNTILSVEQDELNPALVSITLNDDLESGDHQLVVAPTLSLNEEIRGDFTYTQLTLLEVITPSSRQLRLVFNDVLSDDSVEPDNFLIDGDIGQPLDVSKDPVNENQLILNLGTDLTEQPFELAIANNIYNVPLNSTVAAGATAAFNFVVPLLAESIEVLSNNTLRVTFNKALDADIAEGEERYTLNAGNTNPSQVVVNDEELQLTFDEEFVAGEYTLVIEGLETTGGAALSPNPTQLAFSYLPLEVTSVSVVGENSLAITFNQEVDETQAVVTARYLLDDGFENPTEAALSATDPSTVILSFSENFYNHTYTLSISELANASGNSVESFTVPVEVNKPTPAGALIINEIFADPNPKGILPNEPALPTASTAEFVEVLNTTSHTITIGGFSLSGGSIQDFSIGPGEYAALVPSAHLDDYGALGAAVAVDSWNTLTNTGEQILLIDQFGNVLDSVTFSSSWVGDTEKNGGWSLEKINPKPACESSVNWTASVDGKGATPGEQNSVYDDSPDTENPTLHSVEVENDDRILLLFSEKMDLESLSSGVVTLEGYTIINRAIESNLALELQLATPLVSEADYNLTLTGLKDCAGNPLSSEPHYFYHDTKPPVLSSIEVRSFNSLLLSFDEPLQKTPAENEENYSVNHFIGAPSKALLHTENEVLLEFEDSFTIGSSYYLTTGLLTDTLNNAMATETITSFEVAQDIDSVWTEGPNFLSISFSREVNSSALAEAQNYWVGSFIPFSAMVMASNQVRLIFAENFPENKELVLSARNLTASSGGSLITPDYVFTYDTRAPVPVELLPTTERDLLLSFDEEVTESSAEAVSNYALNGTTPPQTVNHQADRKTVVLSFTNAFAVEVPQELAIKNITDIFGNTTKSAIKKTFVFDTLAPSIKNVVVTGQYSLDIIFSEPVMEETATYQGNYSLGLLEPVEAMRHVPDSSIVSLSFGSAIPDEATLVVDDVQDFNENTTNLLAFDLVNDVLAPALATIHSDTQMEVFFNKNIEGFDLSNILSGTMEIVGVGPGSTSSSLLLISDAGMVDGQDYSIKFQNLLSIDGVPLGAADSIVFTYQSLVEEIISAEPFYAELHFTVPLHSDSIASSASFSVNPGSIVPAVWLPDLNDKTVVRLFFSEPLPVDEMLELTFAGLYDEWSRKIPDQTLTFAVDASKPTVDTLYTRGFNEMVVSFSEAITSVTALAGNHYELLDVGYPKEVEMYLAMDNSFLLRFNDDFEDGEDYQLVIQRVRDGAGNEMETDTLEVHFTAPATPQAGDLLVTEIMFDPTPSAGLPTVEYVEIHNNSDTGFDLSTVTFADDGQSQTLDGLLAADEYLILCPAENTGSFAAYGKVLGLAGWSALSNSSDSLTLTNRSGEILDVVVYQNSWYNDTSKDDGGYSLERVFADPFCEPSLNWTASTAESGGTPGGENSVWNIVLDTTTPTVSSVEIQSDHSLLLTFTEAVDISTVTVERFTFSPALETVEAENLTTAKIILADEINASTIYTVSVSGISDCFGNVMTLAETTFAIGEAVEPGDILITEIMADPSPVVGLPEAEYVEIYNRSNKLINLQQVVFADEGAEVHLSELVGPGEYRLLTSQSSAPLFGTENTIGFSTFPSITNSGERLTLKDTAGNVIDEVAFELSWYSDASKADGGYSLERIFADPLCEPSLNWTASTAEWGGTPGAENSVWNIVLDTTTPTVSSAEIVSNNSLLITFSEPVDVSSVTAERFTFSPELSIDTVEVESSSTAKISLTTALDSSTIYTLSASGISDCFGNVMTSGEVIFAIGEAVEPGDLLITEIMADPSPVVGLPEVEYIEIYNRSSKLINLQQVVFADEGAEVQLSGLLEPGAYLLLTASQSFFGIAKSLGLSTFPSVTNSGELLTLKDTTGNVIDEVAFELPWYNNTAKEDGGYSLERIFADPLCEPSLNWAASAAEWGGTPGAENSVWNMALDTEVPELNSITIQNGHTLLITFSEPVDVSSVTAERFTFSHELSIEAVELESTSSAKITLTAALNPSTIYTLSASGISDCFGNVMAANEVIFAIGEAVEPGDILITEIMADPSPVVGLPEAEYVEIYNRSSKLINLQQVVFADEGAEVQLSGLLEPEGYLLLTSQSSAALFGTENTIGFSTFPSITNSGERLTLKDTAGNVIDEVAFELSWYNDTSKEDGGYSLERIFADPVCEPSSNWTASAAESGGTPGRENSVWNKGLDTTAPTVSPVEIETNNSLLITFSEPVDASTVGVENFSFSPELPIEAVEVESASSAKITLATVLDPSTIYALSACGISDCFGNVLTLAETTFAIGEALEPGDILITEIMADPAPVVGLPEAEYVEIYNSSNKLINLQQVMYADEGAEVQLSGLLAPGGYLLLTSQSSAELFEAENMLGFSTFPSITNSGERLTLKDTTGNVIDEVAFELSWYNDTSKDDGGYSLERVFADPLCEPSLNWTASAAEWGGTPGAENLVWNMALDTKVPELNSVTIQNDHTLLITFSEPVDVSSVTVERFTFSPSLLIETVEVESASTVEIILTTALSPSTIYTSSVSGISDCFGNVMTLGEATFAIGEAVEPGDIIITEIMADPSPVVGLPEAEYIEIYNRSSKLINLQQVVFADEGAEVQLSGLLEPGAYLLLTASQSFFGVAKSPGLSTFPSITNSGELLTLKDTVGNVIDEVAFELSWYNNTGKDDGGYSLERFFADPVCEASSNWTASTAEAGGTPGAENSVWNKALDEDAPELSSVVIQKDHSLLITFNKAVDTSTVAAERFSFSPELIIESFEIENSISTKITLATELNPSTIYTFSADGISDCFGNVMAANEMTFAMGEVVDTGDLLITEIMADPSPVVGLPEAEYVEIYNRSSKLINLQQVVFADEGAEVQLSGLLAPGQYLQLTSQSSVALFGNENTIGLSTFPSISNSGERLTLKDTAGNVIDEVAFELSWYKDTFKDDGGYSLERIFADPVCETSLNWTASTAEAGGTPGAGNSVWNKALDTETPELSSIVIQNDHTLLITFGEPVDISTVAAERFTFSPELPIEAIEVENSATKIILTTPLDPSTIYTLSASGISDCFGNMMTLAETTFAVGEAVEPGEILITEIMADPSPVVGLPEAEYVEIYNRSGKLINLQQVVFADEGAEFQLSGLLEPGEYLLLTALASKGSFELENSIGFSTFPSITNSGERLTLKDTVGNVIDEVAFELSWYNDTAKDDGGYSLERVRLFPSCEGVANWAASADPTGGTPGRINSVNNPEPDTTPPALQRVDVISPTELVLVFSKALNPSAVGADFIKVQNGPAITSVRSAGANMEQLAVSLKEDLIKGKGYLVQVSNITDCGGAVLDRAELLFGLGVQPTFGTLIISEFLLDPEPSQGLPEAEFIEIYNPTTDWMSCKGVTLMVDDREVPLPEVNLQPQQYLILSATAAFSLFNEFGNSAGISSFPSLRNDEGYVALYIDNELIHSVNYSNSIYGESAKKEGGWSLEIIDPRLPCAGEENWTASEAPTGGTPGERNSVNATLGDGFGPSVQRVFTEGDSALSVLLSERIRFGRLAIEAAIDPFVPISSISWEHPVADSFRLALDENLKANTSYTLEVKGLADCSGNLQNSEGVVSQFILPASADSMNIVINEVLFNPRSGGVDFVEIYNTSNKHISLQDWKIGNVSSSTGEPGNYKAISTAPLVIAPSSLLVLTSSPLILKADYPAANEEVFVSVDLPTYPNTDGGVVLMDHEGRIMDQFDYREDYHSPFLKELKGVSLERISSVSPTNDPQNWSSAAGSVGFATPGLANSRKEDKEAVADKVEITPRSFIPGADPLNSFVSVQFSNSLSNSIMNARIYDLHGRLIKILAEGQTIAHDGFLRWDGTNISGDIVRVGVYIVQFEFFNASGQTEVLRSTVAVGARF